jgi:hypothetical protein
VLRPNGEDGFLRQGKSSAINPADRLFRCGCGKADCQIAPLRPLRDHMAVLLRAIVSCGMEETLPGYARGDEAWPGVIYPLQMAASIEDVVADPSYVDDSDASFWCETAWNRDEEDRREASSYIAALTVFNFVWLAYEAAIEEAAGQRFSKDKVPVRGRKLLLDHGAVVDRLPSLAFLYRLSRHFCKGAGCLEADVAEIEGKYRLTGAAAAAELGRLFRNYIVHGDDPSPIYREPDAPALYRFYAVAKMLLVLIQALALTRLIHSDRPVPLSPTLHRERERAGWLLANLHLRDDLWLGRDPAGPVPVTDEG